MSRRWRVTWMLAGSLAGLALMLVIAAVLVVRSSWLSEQVRQRIVAEAERATGGRVEIASFTFDWRSLRAQVNGLVIHGSEPAGSPPLARVRTITVVLRVISFVERLADVRSADFDHPEVALLVYPDGRTNVPSPKVRSGRSPLETILNLAIGRFTVEEGAIQVNSETRHWQASGENLRIWLAYDVRGPRYNGEVSIQPLHWRLGAEALDARVQAALAFGRNQLTVSRGVLETARSRAELSGTAENLTSPRITFQYKARLSLDEIRRALRLGVGEEGAVEAAGQGSFRDAGHYSLGGTLHSGPLALRQGKVVLRDVRVESAFQADPNKIEVTGLRVSALGGTFAGALRIAKFDRFSLQGALQGLELGRAASSAGYRTLPWNALLSGPIEAEGRLSEAERGRFNFRARIVVSPAPITAPVNGLIDAHYDGTRGTLDLGQSHVEFRSTRADFTGTLGRELRIHFRSGNLDELSPAIELASGGTRFSIPLKLENGAVLFDGTITGPLADPQIAGHAALASFVVSGEKMDSFSADVVLRRAAIRVVNAHLEKGKLRAQFAASAALRDWRLDDAGGLSVSATLLDADMADLLALAGRKDLPLTGTLSAKALITGTVGSPVAKAELNVVKGVFYGEPFDRLSANVDYANNVANLRNARVKTTAGEATVDGSYAHVPGDFRRGRIEFHAASPHVTVNALEYVRQRSPALSGMLEFDAKGTADVDSSPAGGITLHLAHFDGTIAGNNLELNRKPAASLRLTAATEGQTLTVRVEGTAAGAAIHGDGHCQLAGDYPGAAELAFTGAELATLEGLAPRRPSPFQATGSFDASLSLSGPALRPENWTGVVQIPRLEVAPVKGSLPENAKGVVVRNESPIRLVFGNSVVKIDSARLAGPGTNLALTGRINLRNRDHLDLRVAGTVNVAVLENFDPDLTASGTVVSDGTVRGDWAQPVIAGRMQLKDVNLNYAVLPNGLSNANGVVLFTGDRATIQSLSGESGGGKVSVTGFASYAGSEIALRFDLKAEQVRVRYPEGVSTVADANLNWSGTTQRSLVSGNVTILRTGMNARADFGSILARSSEPVHIPASQTGLLGGMQFDIQIATAPNATVQSALAQQLRVEGSLRLRGAPSNPVLLGRVNITEGEMVFFGNKYTITQGSIAFYNAAKLEPILDIDLQTHARGIDVTLTISGPANKLNVSYRSDPPMQFSDVVALLATGRAPTSDPALASLESGAAQGWQQMGASALVGQAIANPVAGRLQRFFGVSRIKIDPLLTGVDNNPQARLTLEQQVTPDITFTYITNLARSNPQVVQIEWSLNKQWSLVALREESGLFGMDLYYKKRFK